jgi:hypothetical protein
MAQVHGPMTPWVPSPEAVRESEEFTRLFQEAVAEARAENHRLGIPNVQMDEHDRLTEEWPDGRIVILQEAPPKKAPKK